MIVAGLDIGTTRCKLTAFRENGECLGHVYREYPHLRVDTGHEINPLKLWYSVREVLAESAVAWPEIAAIGITSFGETFVLLDERDMPLQQAMLYTDPRGADECEALCEAIGKETLIKITGAKPHAMYSLPKLMWVQRNQPELFSQVKRVCLIADYVVYLLTGNARIDYSLAARTLAFDLQTLAWSEPVLKAAGIDPCLFSKPVPTGTSAGPMLSLVAETLGFHRMPVIVLAGHDQVAAAVGSGVFEDGLAVDGAGTVECITPVFTQLPDPLKMAEGSYAIVPHAVAGNYVSYAFSFTGGAAAQWCARLLAEAAGPEKPAPEALYDTLSGPGFLEKPTGLLVLPHFAGAATPYMDNGSKAAILGLTLETSPHDLFCAIMEGVCYEMRVNLLKLREAGVLIHALHATGGCANNRIWMQIKADVLGIPVKALQTAEAGGTGAAMLAGVVCGAFEDLPAAAAEMVRVREVYSPRQPQHEAYGNLFRRYAALYQAVRPLMDEK